MKKINLKQFSADAQNIPEAKALSDLLQNEFKDNEEIAQYDTADLMTQKLSDLDGYQVVDTVGDLTFAKNEEAPNGDTIVVAKGDDIINAYTELPESEKTTAEATEVTQQSETVGTGDIETVNQPVEEDTQDNVAEFAKTPLSEKEFWSEFDKQVKSVKNPDFEVVTFNTPNEGKISWDSKGCCWINGHRNGKMKNKSEYYNMYKSCFKQFSKVDGDSPAFKAGQEFAKTNPGLDQNAVKVQGEAQNYSGDDLTNFEFGYNSIEKAADLTEKQTGKAVDNTDIKPEDNPQGAVDQESKITPADNVVLKSKIRTFSKQCSISKGSEVRSFITDIAKTDKNLTKKELINKVKSKFGDFMPGDWEYYYWLINHKDDFNKQFSNPAEDEPKKTEITSSEINIVYGARDPEVRQFSSLPDTSEFTDVDWSMIVDAIAYRIKNDKNLDVAELEDYDTIAKVLDDKFSVRNIRKFSKSRQPKLVFKQFS